MEYKKFGKSDLRVSRICLGGWQFGQRPWGVTDKEIIRKIVNLALDNGINFIDTAEGYGEGFSEEIIGDIIRERGDRDEIVIATKVSSSHLRYRDVIKAAERSLGRLKTSYIDLYQIHWPNMYIPVQETIKALEKLVDDGKIRYFGLSNFPPCLAKEAVNATKKYGIISNQVKYNIIERDIENGILPTMRELGIVIMAYSPLAMGLLSGKYDEKTVIPEDDFRARHPLFVNKDNLRQIMRIISILKEIADKYNKTVPQVAINWLLKFDDVFPIIGARKPEHVLSNVGAVGWLLTNEDWMRIKDASDQLELTMFRD